MKKSNQNDDNAFEHRFMLNLIIGLYVELILLIIYLIIKGV